MKIEENISPRKLTTMKSIMNTDVIIAQAERYRQYMQGWAYIPLQDLPRYEKSFKQIYY